jgi:hypothetical protein
MSAVPVYVFFIPVIGLGMGLFWLVAGKRMMASSDRKYGEYRAGDLAQRMGLQIVEGDPALNLMMAQTKHNMALANRPSGGRVGRMLGDSDKQTRVRLEGAPYGRPTQLVFDSYTKHQERIVANITSWSFEYRLSIQLPVEVPPFEIVLRKSGAYGVKAKPEWKLPKQSFGSPDLDAKLTLRCEDRRLGSHLAPVMNGLTSHKYLHIQGNGRIISSITEDPNATMYVTMDIEQTQIALEHMANALAGPVQQRR